MKHKRHMSEYTKQRLSGVVLIATGIAACIAFKEDAGAGIMLILIGFAAILG